MKLTIAFPNSSGVAPKPFILSNKSTSIPKAKLSPTPKEPSAKFNVNWLEPSVPPLIYISLSVMPFKLLVLNGEPKKPGGALVGSKKASAGRTSRVREVRKTSSEPISYPMRKKLSVLNGVDPSVSTVTPTLLIISHPHWIPSRIRIDSFGRSNSVKYNLAVH